MSQWEREYLARRAETDEALANEFAAKKEKAQQTGRYKMISFYAEWENRYRCAALAARAKINGEAA